MRFDICWSFIFWICSCFYFIYWKAYCLAVCFIYSSIWLKKMIYLFELTNLLAFQKLSVSDWLINQMEPSISSHSMIFDLFGFLSLLKDFFLVKLFLEHHFNFFVIFSIWNNSGSFFGSYIPSKLLLLFFSAIADAIGNELGYKIKLL